MRTLWVVTAIVAMVYGLLWVTGWLSHSAMVWLAAAPGIVFVAACIVYIRSRRWHWDAESKGVPR